MKNIYSFLFFGLAAFTASAQIAITQTTTPYSQNFDVLGPGGTSFPAGWGWTAIRSAGSGTVGETLTLSVTDGAANSGGIYNAGTTGAPDRAFGTLASSATVPAFGASFINNTGSTLTNITISFIIEQWRSGSSSAVNEVVPFAYSLNATSLTTGTWVPLPALNLREIQTASANAAPLNGNLGANQLNVSASTGITWNSGATLWIRWTDTDDTASDGLYAIDNFTFLGTSSLGTPENAIAGLSIYPNPVANGKLFITTSSSSEKTVAIFDVLGKQVINTTAAEPVDVSNLPGGVYIAKITQDGKTAARKLIIR